MTWTTTTKKILPYLITSVIVIGLWRLFTMSFNYAWHPQGKQLLMLDIALTTIFIYKALFWLLISNLTVFAIVRLIKKKYKTAAFALVIAGSFYFTVGQYVDNQCAWSYFVVFVNQSVPEESLIHPIKQAGYSIGSILTDNIKDKQMKYRRYAIDGLGEIKYKPATKTLNNLLVDKSEPDYIRADAFMALQKFHDNEATTLLIKFRKQATDTIDLKVITLVDNWTKVKVN